MPASVASATATDRMSWSAASKSGGLSSCRSRLYVSGRPFVSVSRCVSEAWKRAALPRRSSIESGLRFCGISEEPVENSSGMRAKPNSAEDQRTMSSARRERWTPQRAAAKQNSVAGSRSATASIELAVTCGRPFASTKPSSFAVSSRRIGSVVPAMAPEPSGHQLAEALAAARRVRSRPNISA